jgi:hypothetical protein
MEGKVQTNEYGNNIMVEIKGGNTQHHSHLDFSVECEVMSDEEIRTEYGKLIIEPTIKDMKDKLMMVEGFASSNLSDVGSEPRKYNWDSLFRYKRKK